MNPAMNIIIQSNKEEIMSVSCIDFHLLKENQLNTHDIHSDGKLLLRSRGLALKRH